MFFFTEKQSSTFFLPLFVHFGTLLDTLTLMKREREKASKIGAAWKMFQSDAAAADHLLLRDNPLKLALPCKVFLAGWW